MDVIDTASMKRIRTVPVKGAVHYAYLTPDGKYVAAVSVVGKIITIIDVKTLEPVWDFHFQAGVRPVAFEKGADGLTAGCSCRRPTCTALRLSTSEHVSP